MVTVAVLGNTSREATTPSGNIFAEAMRGNSENPLVPQCKFSALTTSQRHHGTLFDAGVSCVVIPRINDLLRGPVCR
jgi:hypothetical protein